MPQPIFRPGIAFAAQLSFVNAAGAPSAVTPENPVITDSFGGAVVVQSGTTLTITLPANDATTITLTWTTASGPITLSIAVTDQQPVVLSDAVGVSIGTFVEVPGQTDPSSA